MGVDVGAERKGCDVAVVDAGGLLELAGGLDRVDVAAAVGAHRPALVAIDGPRRCAPGGKRLREDERLLRAAVCGIRWTPDAAAVARSPYYAWVREALALFDALAGMGADTVEVFPTASWTRWFGARGPATRSAWTRAGLARLGLTGVPARTNQDQRDAIAAAVTARQHARGLTERFGDIVVPAGRWRER